MGYDKDYKFEDDFYSCISFRALKEKLVETQDCL